MHRSRRPARRSATWIGLIGGLAGGVAAVLGATAANAQAGDPTIAVTSVGVIDVAAGALRPNQTVVLRGGRIISVERDGAAPAGAERVDGTGKFLIPGLWDMHVHLRDSIAPGILMPQFIAHGVTGVRDMASDCDGPSEGRICLTEMRNWQRQIDAGELLGPRIVALSSWPVNPPWTYQVTEEQARGVVRQFASQRLDFVKLYHRLSAEAFGWVMDEARRLDIATGGHIPLRVTAVDASNAGLRSLEHARDFIFDCFPGSAEFRRTSQSQDPPTAVRRAMVEKHDQAACGKIFETFVRNQTWYVPTHVTRRMDAFADDPTFRADPRSRYLPTRMWQGWNADADRMVALDSTRAGRGAMRGFYELGLSLTGRAHAAGVPIVLGTDAGDSYVFPGSGAHDELGELVKGGLSPAQALAAATIRAAEFLGRTAEHGTVAAGKRADLVLLTGNPLDDIANTRTIDAVFFNGRHLTRADLDGLLRGVEQAAAKATP